MKREAEQVTKMEFLLPYIYTLTTRTHGKNFLSRLIYFITSAYVAGSTLPFFFANILLYKNYLNIFAYYILGYLLLIPFYEIFYIINDIFAIKRENEEYRTIRIKIDKLDQLCLDKLCCFLIGIRFLIVFLLWYLFIPINYKNIILLILLAIAIVFTIHNIITVEFRAVTTLPMLHFLKFFLIILLIAQNKVAKILLWPYLFSLIIPSVFIYSLKKFSNNKFKELSERTRQIYSIWYSFSIIFNFTVLSFIYILHNYFLMSSIIFPNNYELLFIFLIDVYFLLAILINLIQLKLRMVTS